MSDTQRQRDLEEARRLREQREAEKKRAAMRLLEQGATIKDVMEAVRAERRTVKRWMKEVGNG